MQKIFGAIRDVRKTKLVNKIICIAIIVKTVIY